MGMIRILLPLAVIAALVIAPLYSISAKDSVTNQTVELPMSGWKLVDKTVECWRAGEYSLKGKCEPKGEMKGKAVFAALAASALAAVFGVVSLLPLIGRLAGFVITLAGLTTVVAIGYFGFSFLSGKEGLEALQWGTYLAGGGGLLTLVSGLARMRGK
jgi:hypothetical protein